jgi:hypothetical protein
MADIRAARDITAAVGTTDAVAMDAKDTRGAVIAVVAMLAAVMPAAVSMAANHAAAGSTEAAVVGSTAAGPTVAADRMVGGVAK